MRTPTTTIMIPIISPKSATTPFGFNFPKPLTYSNKKKDIKKEIHLTK